MKYFPKALICFVFPLILLAGFGNQAKACDRTDYVLDSAVFDGTNYTLYTTFCVGGGTAGVNGAGNNTSSFIFAVYGSLTITTSSFSPPSYTSDTTVCTNNANTFGSNIFAGANFGVAYAPLAPCNYTCITPSVAVCGLPHTDCNQFIITTNELPDSIRLYGMESTGNPFAGCYPNPDMLIDFTTLPVVWGDFAAIQEEEVVQLNWSTINEVNNDYFQVMRKSENQDWTQIGTVTSVGNTDASSYYNFTDGNPKQGVNEYKIVQLDIDGRFNESEVKILDFSFRGKMAWKAIGPVPSKGQVKFSFYMENNQEIEFMLFNTRGQVFDQGKINTLQGINNMDLDLSNFADGIYFIRLQGAHGTLDHKIIKI